MRVTRDFIEQGRSANGGWSREQLELLGVAWHPLKGWAKALTGKSISDAQAAHFLALRDAHLKTGKTSGAIKRRNRIERDLDLQHLSSLREQGVTA